MANGAGLRGPGGGPLNIQINAKDLANVVCQGYARDEEGGTDILCGGIIFFQCVEMRVAPALMTGSPQDTVVTIPAYICVQCGNAVSATTPDPAIEAAARPT